MSTVQVNRTELKVYPNTGRYFFAELESGKHSIALAIGPRDVQVMVTSNASHRAWRGMGKSFATMDAAIANYKTGAIRSMLQTAATLNSEAA